MEYAFCLNGRDLDEERSKTQPLWLQRRDFLKEHFESIRQGEENVGNVVENDDGSEESEANFDHLLDRDGSSDEEIDISDDDEDEDGDNEDEDEDEDE